MDDEKIVVAEDVLVSMGKSLQQFCNKCQDGTYECCIGCKVDEVIDTLRVIVSGDVNEWN